MPDYMNPFSMMPNPDDYKAGGLPNVMSGMVAAQRQQQAQPFLDMAQQQMQQQTDTGEQTLQEFMSPHGQEARKAQRQQIIDEGNVYSRTKDSKVLQENEKARLAPFMTDKQIEEAKLGAVVARHELHAEPIKYFSGVFEHLQKVPEAQRKSVYDTLVKTSGYNTDQLPDDLKEYKGSTMGHLAAARYAQVHTPQQEQKIAQEQVPAQASRDVAAINATSAIKRVDMELRAGKFDNLDRLQGHLEEIVRTGKDPISRQPIDEATKEQAQASLRRLKSAKLMDFVNKDAGVQAAQMGSMAAQFSNDPRTLQASRDNLNKAYEDAMARGRSMQGLQPSDLDLPKNAPAPKQLSVGGKNYPVVRTDPDGSFVVNVNGQERRVKPKR